MAGDDREALVAAVGDTVQVVAHVQRETVDHADTAVTQDGGAVAGQRSVPRSTS